MPLDKGRIIKLLKMKELESVVVRFSGDSGDGMQLTGNQFSNTSALMGNDLATFPDFPAEIRAPRGTIAGVSGFQVNIGSHPIATPGDEPDVLVAMNPAALKANVSFLRKGGTIILDQDTFTKQNVKKAGYSSSPIEGGELKDYQVIAARISTQVAEALKDLDLDNKSKLRCKNFYTLGMTYFMFNRDLDPTIKWAKEKFKGKDAFIDANVTALKAGYNYAETVEAAISTYHIPPLEGVEKGTYRQVSGNMALSWGFLQASWASGRELFLGSYPITPASDILHELSRYKSFGVRTFQAEDEIAAISAAIGASFAGGLAVTTTSGPGLALKGEALGLAIIYELPLVVVDVQRGGPSTGLPTKTEQSDLNIAYYGRHGESPCIVLAPCTPSDCFNMAYEASRLSLQHMTPVVLLSDGYIANGSEPWKIPNLKEAFPPFNTKWVSEKREHSDVPYLPYKRDENLVRPWATPGTPGWEHRLGGLEKEDLTGNVSYDPANHQKMVYIRQEKVEKVAEHIPLQKLEGDEEGDVLVASWGGTYGAVHTAVRRLQDQGKKISYAHIKYLRPFPKNMSDILKRFKKVVVPELNLGQLRGILAAQFGIQGVGINKVQGLPFQVGELVERLERELVE